MDALKAEVAEQRKLLERLQAVQEKDAQKPVAAPAAAAASGPQLKFYGVVDVGVTYTNSGFGRKARVEGAGGWSPSRLGFRVDHAFDDGLRAVGVAEGGVRYTDGTIGGGAQSSGSNVTTVSSGGLAGFGGPRSLPARCSVGWKAGLDR